MQPVGRSASRFMAWTCSTFPSPRGSVREVCLDSRLVPAGQLQVQRCSEKTRKWTALVKGNPGPGEYGIHGKGLVADAVDPAGIYLGTTSGQLFGSAVGGAHWDKMPYQIPATHSVEVSSPSLDRWRGRATLRAAGACDDGSRRPRGEDRGDPALRTVDRHGIRPVRDTTVGPRVGVGTRAVRTGALHELPSRRLRARFAAGA